MRRLPGRTARRLGPSRRFDNHDCRPRKRNMGDEGKAVGSRACRRLCLFEPLSLTPARRFPPPWLALSCVTTTDSSLRMSISRMSRGEGRRLSCRRAMRRGVSRRISRSCRSFCVKLIRACTHKRLMSASLIGRLGVKRFQAVQRAVSISLAGSRFSSDSALRPFQHEVRRRGGTGLWVDLR